MIYAEYILICIAVPLAMTALFIKGSARRFILAFMAGMGACLLSSYLGGFAEYVSQMSREDVSVFISPVTEEILKLLPVLFYLYIVDVKSDGILLVSGGIGAGFATFENCCYILTSDSLSLYYVLIRGMAVGVMHLVTMILLAMVVLLFRRHRIFSYVGILGALSMSVTVHALYNLLVSRPGKPSYIGFSLPLLLAVILYRQYQIKINSK